MVMLMLINITWRNLLTYSPFQHYNTALDVVVVVEVVVVEVVVEDVVNGPDSSCSMARLPGLFNCEAGLLRGLKTCSVSSVCSSAVRYPADPCVACTCFPGSAASRLSAHTFMTHAQMRKLDSPSQLLQMHLSGHIPCCAPNKQHIALQSKR